RRRCRSRAPEETVPDSHPHRPDQGRTFAGGSGVRGAAPGRKRVGSIARTRRMAIRQEIILIVDDDQDVLDVTISELRAIGYRAHGTTSTADALAIIR